MYSNSKQYSGQWWQLLSILIPEIQNSLNRGCSHGPCHMHGGGDGFRFFPDFKETGGCVCNTCGVFSNGFELIKKSLGVSEAKAVFLVKEASNYIKKNGPTVSSNMVVETPKFDEDKYKAILNSQKSSVTLDQPEAIPAIRYFIDRGVGIDQNNNTTKISYNKHEPCFEGGQVVHWGAILLHVENDKGLVNMQRIFITKDGKKASVKNPKRLMPSPKKGFTTGAAVRLYSVSNILHVTEGVETALAIRIAMNEPVWAAVTANGMAKLKVPKSVKVLKIWADKDVSGTGEKAAKELAKSVKGQCEVVIQIPPYPIPDGSKSLDWLDVLNMEEQL